MASGWQILLTKCKYDPWILPFVLAFIRIFICFLPQTGYLHPDEFFQSTDIVAGNYYQSNIEPVWEFKTDKPIRCMLIPNILNLIAFKFIELITKETSAYLLIAIPRLIYTLFSFIIDICLYKLCQYYSSRGLWYLPISVIFQTSFICLGCLTRTLSNSPEVVLFSLLLVVICQTIRPTFRILFVTPNRSLPVNQCIKTSKQLTSSIFVGILVTIGTFNRPTFPCFAIVPCIYWIVQSLKKNSYKPGLTFQRVLLPITLSASLTAILISAYDTIYYKPDSKIFKILFNHLKNFEIDEFYSELCENWIFTPYNFIRYNTNTNNLAKYGLHLPFTHMLVNLPLAFNLLALMFYGKLFQLLTGTGVYRLIFSTHRVYALMFLSTLVSITLLSFIPHQEFRFLLPLIVPLVYSFAFNIYASNKLFSSWLIMNFILIYFYTSIHQSGVLRATLDLDKILNSYIGREGEDMTIVNVLAFRCYLVPTYQWNIPKEDHRFNFDLQDTFENFNKSFSTKMEFLFEEQLNNPIYTQKLYMMLPRLYEKNMYNLLESQYKINHTTKLEVVRHYSMHFSGEDFWDSLNYIRHNSFIYGWPEAFGFSLIKLDLS